MLRLVFLGPPGVGKGTQAVRLAVAESVAHVSTGDMLREAIAEHAALGLAAKEFMDRGELVPDEVMIGLVSDRVAKPDCSRGFILDGFPRTLPQAEALDAMLAETRQDLTGVIAFEATEVELIRRLGGRRTCSGCGATFHIESKPPKLANVCDNCGSALMTRDDDQPDAIRRRLQVYHEKTEPLETYYRGRALLRCVDATLGPDDVFQSTLASVRASQGEQPIA